MSTSKSNQKPPIRIPIRVQVVEQDDGMWEATSDYSGEPLKAEAESAAEAAYEVVTQYAKCHNDLQRRFAEKAAAFGHHITVVLMK